MEIKDFKGKVVIGRNSRRRYILYAITSPYIEAVAETPNESGVYTHYRWNTINGDPISNGTLIFEDEALKQPFIDAYNAFCHSSDAYWENYGYWMRKD